MSILPRSAGIYRIDGPNDRMYIGSAVNLRHRWRVHRCDLKRGRHAAKHMQRAWDKHGATCLTFTVLEIVDNPDDLLRIEQVWLNVLFTSLDPQQIYNNSRIAGSNRGTKASEVTREKQRMAYRNRTLAQRQAHRQKLSEAHKGLPYNEERRQQQIGRKVAPCSEERKQRISAANTGKIRTIQHLENQSRAHRKGEIYTMIAPDGTIYYDIASLVGFGKAHGISPATLSNILRGKYKNRAGWRGFITYEDI